MNSEAPNPLVLFMPSGKRGRFPVGTPILDAARQNGMLTLLDDGKRKARNRQTTVEEVIRVLGHGLKDM